MKARLSLHALLVAACFLALRSFAQTPGVSLSPKLVTTPCGKVVCTWNAFGPSTYVRQTDRPEVITATFSVLNVNTQYTMHIDNDGVASAVISVNGVQVIGPSDFNPGVATLDRSITLAASNTVSVELRSKPGTSLAITVIGVDNDPPSVAEFASPSPNVFGWNNTDVGVSFLCSDATSGIAICPASFVLASEGLNQIAQGTALDLAGNNTTSSIQISIDKTPPVITASQTPSPNSSNWNNTPVTVNFSCTDNLSGVQSCNAPVTVATEGANQSVSGKAVDFAGNSASTQASVNIDLTPPSISIASPANGAAVSAAKLQLTGSVSDNLSGVAAVSCNGTPASVTPGSFSCNVTLVSGSNSIQVQATDVAGNTASTQLSVIFNPIPVVPPKAILITPTMASLLSGQTRTVKLVGDIGQLVTGAKWTISDSSVASITPSDPPQLTALAPGTATLTANFSGLSASMTVNVFSGISLPVGTPIWSVDPTPGNTVMQMIRGNPVNSGDPDIFAIERPNTLRAFTADGQQLWTILLDLTTQPFASQAATVSTAAPFAATAANTRTLTTQPAATGLAAPSILETTAMPDSAEPAMAQMVLQFDPMRRFLLRHPEMAGKIPLSSSAAVATNALAPQAATTSIVEDDFLDLSIPDNNGGTVSVITRFLSPADNSKPVVLRGSLVRIDNATQQPSWRYDSPGEILAPIAIAPDNTVYIEEQIVGQCCSFETTGVLAFDGVTGQQKFNLPLPVGHSNIFLAGSFGTNLATNIASSVVAGPLSVMPDGSVTLITATQNLDQTVQLMSPLAADCRGATGGQFLSEVCEIAVSDHRKIQRFLIQPDGSSSTQLIHAFDFDATGCGGDCHDPDLNIDPRDIFFGFFFDLMPAEVIPDGNGGALAAWTGGGNSEPELGAQAAHVSHFDASGGVTDYTVPLSLWNISISDPVFPTFFQGAMMLGENNVVFGSNGGRIEAFDQDSGSEQWNSLPGGSIFLLESKAKGGMNAYTKIGKTVNGLLSFDPFGTLSFFPITTGISSLSYFDASTLLATTTSGQGQMVSGIDSDLSSLCWVFPEGNDIQQSAPVPIQITKVTRNRSIVGGTVNLFVRGKGFGKSPQLIFGDPAKSVSFLTVTNFSYDQDTGVITADVQVAPDAPGGKVSIFVKDGTRVSNANKDAFFFVQIPTSLAGTAFEGTFDTIAATGAGPLHFPSFGQNDFVFDAANEKVDVEDTTPVCGVYRNFAFQLFDQDQPPQPIQGRATITEHLNDGLSINTVTNNVGVFLDTHAAVKTTSCLKTNEFSDITQTFVASVADKTFTLTTVFHITVGNVNGSLMEKTETIHQ